MQRLLYLILTFSILILWSSCRKDFEHTTNPGNLSFSKDTIYLDTVFSNIGSSTYSLTVYNRSKKDINIPSITLENGNDSKYRLNIDGIAANTAQNIPLLAKDSLFIFIETTFDASTVNQNEFLYTDALIFEAQGTNQRLPLVTLIKDAVFLYPKKLADGTNEKITLDLNDNGEEVIVEGFELTDEQLHFTKDKPYVIYGYASVAKDKIANIDAGARIHFHKSSGILVKEGGSININGELSSDQLILENEVILEGDRLEPEFSTIAGQWGGLWLANGSINNTINYLTLKNATVGVFVTDVENTTTPTLTLKNSQIYNSQEINLWAKTAYIEAENLVLGAAGEISLYCDLGGTYTFSHTTIANHWGSSFRENAALVINNYTIVKDAINAKDLVQANFNNCIIDGNKSSELFLDVNNNKSFNYNFSNCLLKNIENNTNPLYNYNNPILYKNIFLNTEPDFINILQNNFNIANNSSAINKGDKEIALLVPEDILGNSRVNNPDIGAYQHTTEN